VFEEMNENVSSNLGRLPLSPKLGTQQFHMNGQTLGLNLEAFWRWSCSDLVSNATRGRLAEFIVAKALGISTDGVRDEWEAYDLMTTDGLKIEVKSAAYIQSWFQKDLSKISFKVPKTHAYDPDTNRQSLEQRRQADVYVFALLAHKDKHTIDPLDLSQWRFYVVPTGALDARTRSQHSIMLPSLEKLTNSIQFEELAARVASCPVF
jgi:hypothetical protein